LKIKITTKKERNEIIQAATVYKPQTLAVMVRPEKTKTVLGLEFGIKKKQN
jgi:hypothetical protein